MSSLIQKPVLIAVRFMSITRSSIPVCINCTVLCASRVPPLCVTAAHSSPVPPAIVRDVPVLSPCRRLSRTSRFPPRSRSGRICRAPPRAALTACSSVKSSFRPHVLFSFSVFVFPFCASLTFSFFDSSTHDFCSGCI